VYFSLPKKKKQRSSGIILVGRFNKNYKLYIFLTMKKGVK